MILKLAICLFIIASTLVSVSFDASFAENLSPRQHWKQFFNLDSLDCAFEHVLLQKNNGSPACVLPSTYLKLVDRGYGNFDPSLMMKRPQMMNTLIQNMASNDNLMNHWHEMMQNNPSVMKQTMSNWISMMKENSELLQNMMGPITSDPQLRKKMIETMKDHPDMENALKQHSDWMTSVHQPMMGSSMGMDQGMKQDIHQKGCTWCPNFETHKMHGHTKGFHSDKMMDLMHYMWINDHMSQDIHEFMIRNPSHMAMMSEQLMNEMLGPVMDDPELQEQMIELMLEHPEFMNSIRHEN